MKINMIGKTIVDVREYNMKNMNTHKKEKKTTMSIPTNNDKYTNTEYEEDEGIKNKQEAE